MLTSSLKALSKKAKPGPGFRTAIGKVCAGSRLFPRQLYLYSQTAENDAALEADVQRKVMHITESFLASMDCAKLHRLNYAATFGMLGLDSIDRIDLVIEIEDKLGIDISNQEAESIHSVSDACRVFTQYYRMSSPSNSSSGSSGLKQTATSEPNIILISLITNAGLVHSVWRVCEQTLTDRSAETLLRRRLYRLCRKAVLRATSRSGQAVSGS